MAKPATFRRASRDSSMLPKINTSEASAATRHHVAVRRELCSSGRRPEALEPGAGAELQIAEGHTAHWWGYRHEG